MPRMLLSSWLKSSSPLLCLSFIPTYTESAIAILPFYSTCFISHLLITINQSKHILSRHAHHDVDLLLYCRALEKRMMIKNEEMKDEIQTSD